MFKLKMYKYRLIKIWMIVVTIFFPIVFLHGCTKFAEQEGSSSSSSTAPAPITQIHEDKPPLEKALEVNKSLIDSTMIHSIFIDIFGPAALNLTTIKRIKNEKSILGGPCSLYDNFKSNTGTALAPVILVDSKSISCNNSESTNDLSAAIQPAANVPHQALVNSICGEALDNGDSFSYLMEQLKENTSAAIASNTSENVLKLFKLFYRGKPLPDQKLIASLQYLIGTPSTNEGWKAATLITCISSHWQAL